MRDTMTLLPAMPRPTLSAEDGPTPTLRRETVSTPQVAESLAADPAFDVVPGRSSPRRAPGGPSRPPAPSAGARRLTNGFPQGPLSDRDRAAITQMAANRQAAEAAKERAEPAAIQRLVVLARGLNEEFRVASDRANERDQNEQTRLLAAAAELDSLANEADALGPTSKRARALVGRARQAAAFLRSAGKAPAGSPTEAPAQALDRASMSLAAGLESFLPRR